MGLPIFTNNHVLSCLYSNKQSLVNNKATFLWSAFQLWQHGPSFSLASPFLSGRLMPGQPSHYDCMPRAGGSCHQQYMCIHVRESKRRKSLASSYLLKISNQQKHGRLKQRTKLVSVDPASAMSVWLD